MNPPFAFLGLEAPSHWIMLAAIGILLFGKRLPEIGRSLGISIQEFKKGLHGLEDEIVGASTTVRQDVPSLEPPRPPQRVQTTAPKFEDPPSNMPVPPAV